MKEQTNEDNPAAVLPAVLRYVPGFRYFRDCGSGEEFKMPLDGSLGYRAHRGNPWMKTSIFRLGLFRSGRRYGSGGKDLGECHEFYPLPQEEHNAGTPASTAAPVPGAGRTIREALDKLPEPYRSAALRNMGKGRGEIEAAGNPIGRAFVWSDTPEGETFWRGVRDAVERGAPLPPYPADLTPPEPVFPATGNPAPVSPGSPEAGMTLRETVAMHVLPAVIRASKDSGTSVTLGSEIPRTDDALELLIARRAFAFADAFIAAGKEGQP